MAETTYAILGDTNGKFCVVARDGYDENEWGSLLGKLRADQPALTKDGRSVNAVVECGK